MIEPPDVAPGICVLKEVQRTLIVDFQEKQDERGKSIDDGRFQFEGKATDCSIGSPWNTITPG